MLLGALPRDLRANAVTKLEQDPRYLSMCKNNKRRKNVTDKCATADALAILDLECPLTAPGVCSYSIPAAVPLSQMPVVVNLPAIPSQKTLAPAQATLEMSIAKAKNTMDTKMDNVMKAFEA
jgi:hypothetical protein